MCACVCVLALVSMHACVHTHPHFIGSISLENPNKGLLCFSAITDWSVSVVPVAVQKSFSWNTSSFGWDGGEEHLLLPPHREERESHGARL